MRKLAALVLVALLGVAALWTRGGQSLTVLDRETLTKTTDGFVLAFPEGLASVALSEDGATIVLAHNVYDPAGSTTRLVIVDSRTAAVRWSDTYPNRVCCLPPFVRLTPDGERVLGVGDVVRVYSDEGQVIFQTDLPSEVFGLAAALSDDGRLAAVISSLDRAYLYSVPDGRAVWSGEFEGGDGLALSGDGRLMLIAENQAAHLYDTASHNEIATWPLRYAGSLVLAGLSRDGSLAVTAGYPEERDALLVTIKDAVTGQQTEVSIPTLSIPELQIAPDGVWIRIMGRLWGGSVLIARDGTILLLAARGEGGVGDLLARSEEQLARAAGPNVQVAFGEQAAPRWTRAAGASTQGLWFTGDTLAVLASDQPRYPLSDRLHVWSVYNP